MNSGNNSVTVLNPTTGAIQATLTTGILSPVAIAVDQFGPGGVFDIAVLNSDSTVLVFANTSATTGNVSFDPTPAFTYNLGASGMSMTSGHVAGNASLADLVVVTNSPGENALWVLQNTSTAAGLSFSPHQISNSVFNGTPVQGQGVATGILSVKGVYGEYEDIAVAYAAAGTIESMVAVFQNLDGGFQFLRTSLPGSTTPDFYAGQTNPTAIALLFLTSSATASTTPWEDIVVTNNDNLGTVSVLQPVALPSTTIAQPTQFTDSVNISGNPGPIDNLTVTIALVDQESVSNLSIVLEAPNDEGSIALVDNQDNAAGTADTGVGLPSGNAIGVYGFTTGATGKAGVIVGTIFDDNATRNIFDPTTTGTNGNSAAGSGYIGYFRPESGETLESFIASLGGKINGTWTLVITNFSSTLATGVTAQADLEKFSLQFSTGMNVVSRSVIASTFVTGALGNDFTKRAVPATPNGVGPGLVLAIDNTLGSASPYQGRIYAAYVGYYDFTVDGVVNPTTDTDIFLTYSDDGGQTWSAPVQVNDDSADSDGFSGSNDPGNNPNDEVNGRTTFQPAIAVDPTTGTVVISWRDARNDPADELVATYITTSIDGGNTFSAQNYANRSETAVDAITDQTDVLDPEADNQSATNSETDKAFGYGDQMGLAVFGGQVYPIWAGNFDEASLVNGVPTGNPLNIWYTPMVIAAGPRIVSSTMGPVPVSTASFTGTLTNGSATVTGIPTTTGLFVGENVTGTGIAAGTTIAIVNSLTSITLSANATVNGVQSLTTTVDGYEQAQQYGQLSFTVTFDRPVTAASFVPGDVFVYYHDTTDGDPFIQVPVLSVNPVALSATGTATEFTIVFSVSGITNYTGTYSYLIAPDNGAGLAISSPIESYSGPLVNGIATLREDDPDDQNADGTPDENALTTSYGPA